MLESAILDDARFSAVQRELLALTDRLLQAIHAGDSTSYASMCAPDLSCYEDVCAYRIDGLAFHTHLVKQARQRPDSQPARFDILHPRVQVYGDAAVVTYTRLMTYDGPDASRWETFNESRVFARIEGGWKMVHFHRSRT